jgi:hypothetical protein
MFKQALAEKTLFLFIISLLMLSTPSCNKKGVKLSYNFNNISDRIWIGEDFWTVPVEDWQLKNGRIECTSKIVNAHVSLLPYVLSDNKKDFSFSADMGLIEKSANNGSSGFSIGVEALEEQDIRSAIYFGSGINLGVNTEGFAFLGQQTQKLPENFDYSAFNINISGSYPSGKLVLEMILSDKDGNAIAKLSLEPEAEIRGIIQLKNNMVSSNSRNNGPTFWFDNISLEGGKFESTPSNSFGPVFWTMYTVNANVLKLSAQMPPLGDSDNKKAELQLKKGNAWETVATASVSETARVATFKVENWDMSSTVPYRVSHEFINTLGKMETALYEGIIQQEPADRPVRVGALTCQYHYGFPYSPLVKNLGHSKPDLLYFSGDQIYEQNGGYPIKREPEDVAILNYLGKWYMFGWAFGDLMRNIPTICTPDDHDVFQGNIWGESGTNFMQTTPFINVVNETQCAHLPDPVDPTPIGEGMSVWYTVMKYGRIDFAIVSDRVFKSDPKRVATWDTRADHILAPLKNPGSVESPDLELLGERQENFLREWVRDWKGVDMKVLLCQTVFANVATHHGKYNDYLYGDMDSGGWPKKARDRALDILRRGYVFQIAGDQHLPSITQYGIENYRDAGWCFVTPAIAVGYSRWFRPDDVNMPVKNRPAHGNPNTGEYVDAFGNLNYVYAIGNPVDFKQVPNRYELAQVKTSGYAMVILDPATRNITMESWRFLANVENPGPDDQHPGWPLTISQFDNYGREAKAWLPAIEVTGEPNPVIEVINNKTLETEYIVRIIGNKFSPKVFSKDTFTVKIGYPESGNWKTVENVNALDGKDKETIQVTF